MDVLTKREINMLKSFKGTRFWRVMPDTAERLLDKGYIKPTKFGMGNFQLTDKARHYLKIIGEIQ